METIEEIRRDYAFGEEDERHLKELVQIILPVSEQFGEDFYAHLKETPYTASFFPTPQAVARRKKTIQDWLKEILSGPYDHRLVVRLQRIGRVHVKVGLEGHHVNAAMNFIRIHLRGYVIRTVGDQEHRMALLVTLDKVLDISLDVMTSSYREAELKKVFLSRRVESWLVRWSERLLHGLNLALMVGLVVMATGVASLLVSDIFYALSGHLESGVIKALGSLLVLWMMIELLHTQVGHLRGGRFHVGVFVELALVAFIRKLFVATIDKKDPVTIGLFLAGLLVLGLVFFLVARAERSPGR